MVRDRFLRFTLAHGAEPAAAGRWWNDVAARYAEGHRHYHTLRHIEEMLDLLPHADETVLAAVWFHDAVYGESSNEEQSAILAREALTALRFPPETIGIVESLILATKTHDPAQLDARFHPFLDADLAILGSAPERYQEYTEQVRREYEHVREAFFRGARAAILDRLLSRPRIYASDEFFARFERQARENIARELSAMSRNRV
jgi:predicted metal-dependent HD superfamily phosphohydrolase